MPVKSGRYLTREFDPELLGYDARRLRYIRAARRTGNNSTLIGLLKMKEAEDGIDARDPAFFEKVQRRLFRFASDTRAIVNPPAVVSENKTDGERVQTKLQFPRVGLRRLAQVPTFCCVAPRGTSRPNIIKSYAKE